MRNKFRPGLFFTIFVLIITEGLILSAFFVFFAKGSLTTTYGASGLAVDSTVSHFLPGLAIVGLVAAALLAIAGTRFIVYLLSSRSIGEIERLRDKFERLQQQQDSLSDVNKVS